MIRVRVGRLAESDAEAVIRPVRSDLESLTAQGRELEDGAGAGLRARLATLGDAPPGSALITPAGDLPSAFLIHAVLQSPDQPVDLRTVELALSNTVRRAEEWGLSTLALPPLGTGAGQMEVDEVADVMITHLRTWLRSSDASWAEIVVPGAYESDVFQGRLTGG